MDKETLIKIAEELHHGALYGKDRPMKFRLEHCRPS